jgi:hypothetical protein
MALLHLVLETALLSGVYGPAVEYDAADAVAAGVNVMRDQNGKFTATKARLSSPGLRVSAC